MNNENRIVALQSFLMADHPLSTPPVIEHSGYDNEFMVNPHTTHDGMSPSKAESLVELVRKALRIVVGKETDNWRASTLMEMQVILNNNKDVHQKLADTLNRAEAALPVVNYKRDLTKVHGAVLIRRHIKKGTDWRRDPEVFDSLSNGGGGVLTNIGRSEENEYVVIPLEGAAKFGAKHEQKVKDAWRNYQQTFDLAKAETDKMEGIYSYDMLTRKFRENPETLEMTKVGIHDLVNTLYHISPEQYKGPHSEDRVLTLREAFDGTGITDRTKAREASDSEWAVVTEEEANQAVYDYIENYLWAFNYSFLKEWFVVDDVAGAEDIHAGLCEKCEDGNDGMKAMVNWDVNKQEIVDSAIKADGRGHFMNSYDGNEHEVESDGETFYIYRTN